MFKMYPKTFENVFTEGKSQETVNIDWIKIRGFETQAEYIDFARKELRRIFENEWMNIIQSSWMFFKFTYNGRRRAKMYANDFKIDAAFSLFHRQYVGIDIRFITRSSNFNKIFGYFEDFYPDFDDHNPFEDPDYFKFPYKNITIDFLPTVYQMPERLEILAYVDSQAMNYNEYLDYLLNYIHSYNEEQGYEIYQLNLGTEKLPYIMDKRQNLNHTKKSKWKN